MSASGAGKAHPEPSEPPKGLKQPADWTLPVYVTEEGAMAMRVFIRDVQEDAYDAGVRDQKKTAAKTAPTGHALDQVAAFLKGKCGPRTGQVLRVEDMDGAVEALLGFYRQAFDAGVAAERADRAVNNPAKTAECKAAMEPPVEPADLSNLDVHVDLGFDNDLTITVRGPTLKQIAALIPKGVASLTADRGGMGKTIMMVLEDEYGIVTRPSKRPPWQPQENQCVSALTASESCLSGVEGPTTAGVEQERASTADPIPSPKWGPSPIEPILREQLKANPDPAAWPQWSPKSVTPAGRLEEIVWKAQRGEITQDRARELLNTSAPEPVTHAWDLVRNTMWCGIPYGEVYDRGESIISKPRPEDLPRVTCPKCRIALSLDPPPVHAQPSCSWTKTACDIPVIGASGHRGVAFADVSYPDRRHLVTCPACLTALAPDSNIREVGVDEAAEMVIKLRVDNCDFHHPIAVGPDIKGTATVESAPPSESATGKKSSPDKWVQADRARGILLHRLAEAAEQRNLLTVRAYAAALAEAKP